MHAAIRDWPRPAKLFLDDPKIVTSQALLILAATCLPMRMQSGMPIPVYPFPATCRPGIAATRASISFHRALWPTVYCAIERGQREIDVNIGAAVKPKMRRNSSLAILTKD